MKTTADIISHPLVYLLLINKKQKQEKSSVSKDMKKLAPLSTVGGNVKWYSYSGKQYSDLPQN